MDWTGDTILALRERLGLSQAEFAEVLGVHSLTVSAWEWGRTTHPNACTRAFLDLIHDHQEAAEVILSLPIPKSMEPIGDRIKRLRSELSMTQREMAMILMAADGRIVWQYESGRNEPTPCVERMLDLFEFHREEAAPYLWPFLYA